jgi:hypothetical protein
MTRLLLSILTLTSSVLADAPPLKSASLEDKALYATAREAILQNGRKPCTLLSESNESWFWTNSHRLTPLLDAYEFSGDREFLAVFVSLMESILAERYTHPTDPDTWSGWYHYKTRTHSYMVIHAGIVYYQPALRFVEIVRTSPDLKSQYGEVAGSWYKDITEVSIPAWDKRGCWKEIGSDEGWYIKLTQKPDPDTHELIPEADRLAGTTYAYNKLHEMLNGFLIAYRLTDNSWYRDRIEKCARVFRKNWRIDNDHTEWNYRGILGPWDYKSGKMGEGDAHFTSWIHPKGGYYGTDVGYVVNCYNHGIGFGREYIEKLIQTNTTFMFRGEDASPRFTNIDGSFKVYEESDKKSFGHGSLWSSLAQFSPRIRELWKAQIDQADPTRYDYANSVMGYLLAVSKPISWQPQHVR